MCGLVGSITVGSNLISCNLIVPSNDHKLALIFLMRTSSCFIWAESFFSASINSPSKYDRLLISQESDGGMRVVIPHSRFLYLTNHE